MVQLTPAAPVDAITTLFCFQNASFSIDSHLKVAVYSDKIMFFFNNNFNIFPHNQHINPKYFITVSVT